MLVRQGRLDGIVNMEDVRQRARRVLPQAVFDAIDGGATDEITLRENRAALDRIWLRPRALADVNHRDISTTVLGQRISMPLMLDPCALARVCNPEGEVAVARAAGDADTIYTVPMSAGRSLEQIIEAATPPFWYQLYMQSDHETIDRLLDRVELAGFYALCVTIDSAVIHKRERDLHNHLTLPLKLSGRTMLAAASRPRWSLGYLLGGLGRGQRIDIGGGFRAVEAISRTVQHQAPVTFADVQWLRKRWKGKLVLKGVMRADECPKIVDFGVDGIVVSNHGGRNLDGVRATIDVLPEVVEAVGGRAEVFVDGGILRGTDVVKALALGARACLIGRPYLFGLAVGGQAGVARVLEILRAEIEQTMALVGCATVGDIDRSLVYLSGDSHPMPGLTLGETMSGT
jgi:isopentenyl diphosphate isomerase/L-lactate dehydrogenase-like FMN-dependent dehydrogenase